MPVPIAVWLLAAAAVSAPSSACGWDGKPALEAMHFRRRGSDTSVNSVEHKRGSRWGRYLVSAELFNRHASSQDVVLIASIEVIVAPRILPPELRGKDLTKEVGWGVLADTEYVKSRVIRNLDGCLHTETQLFDIDLDKLLASKFTGDGGLWLWSLRVSGTLLAPNATVLSSAQAMLSIVPDESEQTGALLPSSRIIATGRQVSPRACARVAPSRPARYAWR
jgi:hypothetical protein